MLQHLWMHRNYLIWHKGQICLCELLILFLDDQLLFCSWFPASHLRQPRNAGLDNIFILFEAQGTPQFLPQYIILLSIGQQFIWYYCDYCVWNL